jgi:hypothetical protein
MNGWGENADIFFYFFEAKIMQQTKKQLCPFEHEKDYLPPAPDNACLFLLGLEDGTTTTNASIGKSFGICSHLHTGP